VEPDPRLAAPLAGGLLGSLDGAFVVVEWEASAERIGPLAPVAPLHVHHEDDEAWYVLEGTLGFRLDDRDIDVGAGGALMAPRGTPHAYWNAGPGAARYLLVMAPLILRLTEELHDSPPLDRAALEAVFRRYRSELL
jgi:mannose-6-phosphate isomerase-like protein (cupin superfamily)